MCVYYVNRYVKNMEWWSSAQVYFNMIPQHTRMTLPYKMYGTIVYSEAEYEKYL